MARKLKLTITQTRRQTVTLPTEMFLAYCTRCGRDVAALNKIQAMRMLETKEENFNALTTAGLVHTLQTVTGHLLVCKDSLFLTEEGVRQ